MSKQNCSLSQHIGPQGPTGPQGEMGITGPAGCQGYKGHVGIEGEMGPRGPTGPSGPKGDTGPRGDTGATGETGPAGCDNDVQGPLGPVGPRGPTGPSGPKGETGDCGDKGKEGIQGPKGPDGATGRKGMNGMVNVPTVIINSLTPQSYTMNKNNLIPSTDGKDNSASGDPNMQVRAVPPFTLDNENHLVIGRDGIYHLILNLYVKKLESDALIDINFNGDVIHCIMKSGSSYFNFSHLFVANSTSYKLSISITDAGKNNVNAVDSCMIVRRVGDSANNL